MHRAVLETQAFGPREGFAPGKTRRGHVAAAGMMLGMFFAIAVLLGAMIFVKRVRVAQSVANARVEVPARSVAEITPPAIAPPAISLLNADAAPNDEKPAADAGPEWLNKRGQLNGKEYEIAVKSGLYVTIPECQRALEAAERQSVREYLDSYLGPGAAELVNLDSRYIHDKLRKQEYTETVQASIGAMQQMHALLAFDDQARSDFHDRWRQALVTRRLWYVGGGAAIVLAAVASAFGLLSAGARAAEREAVPQ